MEFPHPIFEDRISIDRAMTTGQLREQARESAQAPPVHCFDAIASRRRVRAGKAAPLEFGAVHLEVCKRHSEPLRSHSRRHITSIRNARGTAHLLLPRTPDFIGTLKVVARNTHEELPRSALLSLLGARLTLLIRLGSRRLVPAIQSGLQRR